MRYQETETIELKSSLTTSFEKELVAFLNTHNGTIYIGVNDNGDICGVDNLDETMCKISDIITDCILPNPQELVTISTKLVNALWIIEVNVTRGNLLYYIGRYGRSSKGCYIRVGTTCKSMTEKQIETRYKEIYSPKCDITKIESTQNDLTFKQLKIYYTEKNYHLSNRTFKKNLHLLTTTGKYNLLAEMLADENRVSIKIARFKGRDKSELSEKSEYGYKCLLIAIDKIINCLEAENYAMSIIKSGQRIDKRLFDMSSLREIFINAIAHNDWTIVEPAIYIFDNRIEIISHSVLPDGQTVEMFYKGISTPRNKELMRILADLNYVEQTGHGIPNVIKVYGKKFLI